MNDEVMDELGPIDYLVVEFPAGKADFSGAMAEKMKELVEEARCACSTCSLSPRTRAAKSTPSSCTMSRTATRVSQHPFGHGAEGAHDVLGVTVHALMLADLA
jgi:hypothetical protein